MPLRSRQLHTTSTRHAPRSHFSSNSFRSRTSALHLGEKLLNCWLWHLNQLYFDCHQARCPHCMSLWNVSHCNCKDTRQSFLPQVPVKKYIHLYFYILLNNLTGAMIFNPSSNPFNTFISASLYSGRVETRVFIFLHFFIQCFSSPQFFSAAALIITTILAYNEALLFVWGHPDTRVIKSSTAEIFLPSMVSSTCYSGL